MPRLVALGGLALLGDDGPLPGSAARGRNLALLAILARAGDIGLGREKLAAYLWPESDADRARHSLEQSVYTLRRALGSDAFVAGATTLALNAGVIGSDVAAFTAASEAGDVRRAVSLYGGPFLDGFHLSGVPTFEHWVDGERALLHRQWTAALEAMARAVTRDGDVVAAVAYWRRLAAAEPLNSRVTISLMRALDEAGDRAGSLQVAAAHTRLVKHELDAVPDASVLEYESELRRESRPAPSTSASAGNPMDPGPEPGGAGHSYPVDSRGEAGALAQERSPDPGTMSAPPFWRQLWFSVAGAAVVIAALAILASRGPPAVESLPAVAIASFQNDTGDAVFEPVGRMAADWIIEGLVRTGLVRVTDHAGRASVAGGIESAVSGRLYMTGDTLWLQATIKDAENGVVLRALDAVSTPASNPAGALEPLRQQVLGALGTLYDPRLTAWAESSLRAPSFAAYQEFAAGLELHAVPRDLAGAAERFRAAAALDPEYVLPRLWLSWASVLMGDWATADSVVSALRSRRDGMSPLERAWHDRIAALLAGDNEASYMAAKRMVEIAPRSGWVLALANAALDTNRPGVAVTALSSPGLRSLGLEREHGWFLLTVAYHQLGEYRRELATTDEAIAAVGLNWGYLGPGLPALAALGRIGALEQRLEELRVLPADESGIPRVAASLLTAATELRAHGHVDEAAAMVDRILERDAERGPDGPAGRWARLQLLYEMGWWQDAERLLADVPAVERQSIGYQAMAGLLAARRGDRATADRVAADLAAVEGRFLFGEPTFWRARIAAVLDNAGEAVSLLRQAFAEGQAAMAWRELHVARDFDSLRRDRSFRELLRPGPAS